MTNNIVHLSGDKPKFNTIPDALEALRQGKFVIVADAEDRENEGDLICAASLMTPAMVNFMAREARGLICVAMPSDRAEALDLNLMVTNNTEIHQTAFTVSVDAGPEFGVSTGISASDRAVTIQQLVSPHATAKDFRRPGHIFPLIAQKGGVLRRVGHTEAAIDLTRLAGLPEMGVICEIMNDDGTMARRDDLFAFAQKHDFPFITISQIIAYLMERERFVVRKVQTPLETVYGDFIAMGYMDRLNGVEHLALIKGSLEELRDGTPLVRVQQENMILDMLRSNEDPEVQNLGQAMQFIESQGAGVVIYLRGGNGSPNGLLGKLKTHSEQLTQDPDRRALNNMASDLREYGVGAQILSDLGITKFRMITNTPKKIVALRGYGLEVVDMVPLPAGVNKNRFDFIQPTNPEKLETPKLMKTPNVMENAPPSLKSPANTVKSDNKANDGQANSNTKPAKDLKPMRMGGQIMSTQIQFEG